MKDVAFCKTEYYKTLKVPGVFHAHGEQPTSHREGFWFLGTKMTNVVNR